ncbi:tRNA lysidine(34) synthetase TilS [Phenylobacterium sp.]|uniref:tRNA lysidine(34) synthetase TilS n=1 Tax=Phenylobacterium sp. TaxID=1871053 RepID=UPI002DE1FD5C|nr:tRNA lysidine(34) synthetase TilS [Phenylobacterium sp.]
MRLAALAPELPDLDRHAAVVFDRRLSRASPRPVAVALSGGGDSVALLLAAHTWALTAGRPLLALTLDHGLQPQGAAWTQACAARAAALGVGFQALSWTGDKPTTGLPAAARAARHRLLADAARGAGAAVIVMGHTADDIAEARAMRAAGGSTPEPREWGPSPAWPEGRRIFLLRPLLGVRRGEIRGWLTARGEAWIEDPANADPRYARARARRDLAPDAPVSPAPATPDTHALAAATTMDAAGVLLIERDLLRAATMEQALAFVGAACLCAAGTTRPSSAERIGALADRLQTAQAFAATLAGARIEADDREVRFLREPGEAARGGLAPLVVAGGETAVWDGRFEIDGPGEVRALAGHAARLPKEDRAVLSVHTPKARAALPMDGDRLIEARPLALARLHAACGLVAREPD